MSYFNEVFIKDFYGNHAEVSPMGDLRSVSPYRLVGATFTSGAIDNVSWSGSLFQGATIYQPSAEVELRTNTTANASASFASVRSARYIGGYGQRFRAQVQLGDTGAANNLRFWGAATVNDGCGFELSGSTLNAVTIKAGVYTRVPQASWNTDTNGSITLTNCNSYEIYWTNKSVYFVINDVLKHKASFSTTTWSNTMHLPVRLKNENFNDATSDVTLKCRTATIHRLGPAESAPLYRNITTAATYVLKSGPGRLHHIVVGTVAGNGSLLTIYDNTAGSGTVICTVTVNNQTAFQDLSFDLDFFTGLCIVSTGTWSATVVYE